MKPKLLFCVYPQPTPWYFKPIVSEYPFSGMNFIHRTPASNQDVRHPEPPVLPACPGIGISACYRGARVGGDFYDFVELGHNRLLFVLLDIAGKKDEALSIA